MAGGIAQWLEGFGLGQHAKTFVDNDIDLEALPHLRDEDFARLGVSLGHMRRLQAAIAAMPPSEPIIPRRETGSLILRKRSAGN